jgi:hypothetical protein
VKPLSPVVMCGEAVRAIRKAAGDREVNEVSHHQDGNMVTATIAIRSGNRLDEMQYIQVVIVDHSEKVREEVRKQRGGR